MLQLEAAEKSTINGCRTGAAGRRLRLCCVIQDYPPTRGPMRLVHDILRQLLVSDVDVVALSDSTRCDPQDQTYILDGVRVHRLGLSRTERWRLTTAPLVHHLAMRWPLRLEVPRLARLGPFAEHAHAVYAVGTAGGGLTLAAERAARRAGKPFVLTPLSHPHPNRRHDRSASDLCSRADAIIPLGSMDQAQAVLGDLLSVPTP